MNSPQKRRKKDGASSAASPAPPPPLAGTVLEVSRACQTYQRTNTTWKRKNCAIEDCSQFQSSTGCKFLNSDGMCYTPPGQAYCKLNAKDSNCRTKESGAIAKAMYEERPECKPAPPPESNPQKKKPATTSAGAREFEPKYLLSAQCKAPAAQTTPKRRKGSPQTTGSPKTPSKRTKSKQTTGGRQTSSKNGPLLPGPSSKGLRAGFQGRFYYMGAHIDRIPNLSSWKANAIRISETIDYSSRPDFQVVAPDFPENYFAGVWKGVFKVERAGDYTFSCISEDG